MSFDDDFVWGISSSAYQTEGAVAEDGRAPSVWDTFASQPGRIIDATDASTACDHYHRYRDDFRLLSELGVGAYRFSIAWSRIQPESAGPPNAAGLDFYDRVVDELLQRDIAPIVNLFHWDLPQWLQDEGGWQDRAVADRFADYAQIVAERLGDRVAMWGTINEMFEHFALGHLLGTHAPGLTLPLESSFAVAHHLLLAHGSAVRTLRAYSPAPIMAINSFAGVRPATDSESDVAAADLYDLIQNRLFTDPLILGSYPEGVTPLIEPWIHEGDLEIIASPIDRLGVNYYSINEITAADAPVPLAVGAPRGYPVTSFGWAVAPEGLTDVLVDLHTRYGDALMPLLVTENGCAYDDAVDANGECDDPERVAFLGRHIGAVGAAIDAGVDVRGYCVWSLLDNFEWAEGYTKRFGLVHVDFETQVRTPKTSFTWFKELIKHSDKALHG